MRFNAAAARNAVAPEVISAFRRSTSWSDHGLFSRRIGFSKGARRTGGMVQRAKGDNALGRERYQNAEIAKPFLSSVSDKPNVTSAFS